MRRSEYTLGPWRVGFGLLVAASFFTVIAGRAAAQPFCAGDCSGDGQVTVDEILTMVNVALGSADVNSCMAGDANNDHNITVDEILSAVSNALRGCSAVLPSCDQLHFNGSDLASAFAAVTQGLSNPWDNLTSVITGVAAQLHCVLTPAPLGTQAEREAADLGQDLASCEQTYCADVLYCGPGNSQTNPGHQSPVSSCMNQTCFHHDQCYTQHCVAEVVPLENCVWTRQSAECDQPFFTACNDPTCATTFWEIATCWIATNLCESALLCANASPLCDLPPCATTLSQCNPATGVCDL